ncbi:MAG: hypothetical protein V4510_08475 [bacterium]
MAGIVVGVASYGALFAWSVAREVSGRSAGWYEGGGGTLLAVLTALVAGAAAGCLVAIAARSPRRGEA